MFKDLLIQASFWSNLFYTISYPCIHLYVMNYLSQQFISLNQILYCIFIIVINSIWNKHSNKLYPFLPLFLFLEVGTYLVLHLFIMFGYISPVCYYLIDTLLYCFITRNVLCGANKLQTLLYKGEKRERYDNTISIASATSTLIGGVIAFCFPISSVIFAFIFSWIGISIDNLFYVAAYYKSKKKGK